jgi:hypothetical protein
LLKPWHHRDLRRTAKVLMMRAGVSREISERCLAHEIAGVEASMTDTIICARSTATVWSTSVSSRIAIVLCRHVTINIVERVPGPKRLAAIFNCA